MIHREASWRTCNLFCAVAAAAGFAPRAAPCFAKAAEKKGRKNKKNLCSLFHSSHFKLSIILWPWLYSLFDSIHRLWIVRVAADQIRMRFNRYSRFHEFTPHHCKLNAFAQYGYILFLSRKLARRRKKLEKSSYMTIICDTNMYKLNNINIYCDNRASESYYTGELPHCVWSLPAATFVIYIHVAIHESLEAIVVWAS